MYCIYQSALSWDPDEQPFRFPFILYRYHPSSYKKTEGAIYLHLIVQDDSQSN